MGVPTSLRGQFCDSPWYLGARPGGLQPPGLNFSCLGKALSRKLLGMRDARIRQGVPTPSLDPSPCYKRGVVVQNPVDPRQVGNSRLFGSCQQGTGLDLDLALEDQESEENEEKGIDLACIRLRQDANRNQ